MKYIAKPVDAIQWNGNNTDEILKWLKGKWRIIHVYDGHEEKFLHLATNEYSIRLAEGEWILQDHYFRFTVLSNAYFLNDYDLVEDKQYD